MRSSPISSLALLSAAILVISGPLSCSGESSEASAQGDADVATIDTGGDPDGPLEDAADGGGPDSQLLDTSTDDLQDIPIEDVLDSQIPDDLIPDLPEPPDAAAPDAPYDDATDSQAPDASLPDLADGGQPGPGNPDSVGFGTRKTINIDGANTDGEWGGDTLLILDPAADDARFLGSNWSAHEPPWDYVALHAAWDDTSLYIGIQYVNVTDVLDPANLGSSEGSQIHGMDLIQFLAFDTIPGQGYSVGGDMWDKDHEFIGDDQPDLQLYFHSNFSQEGTYLGRWDGEALRQFIDGNMNPDLTGAGGEFFVGDSLMGVDPTADDETPGEYGPADVDYIGDRGHEPGHDTFFELQIPLALLEIDAELLDRSCIGVFAANGDGSAVDSIPDDPATSSTPGVSNSNSPLEWSAADDDDQYSVPFARIGTP